MVAIVSTEIGMPILRTEVPGTTNAEGISKDLDTADEHWKVAAIRIESYQQRMVNLFNKHIKPCAF